MLNKLRERMGREEGFTLVELLVVMLILGILAAIAIPTFFNQRDKARDADAKASARTAETAMETYATEEGGDYGGAGDEAAVEARLVGIEETLQAADLSVSYPAGDGDASTPDPLYQVTYASENTPNTFSITRLDNGTKEASCTDTSNDGCPSDGDWFAAD